MNPFDWRGPQFLVFYLLLLAVGLILSLVLRKFFRLPVDDPITDLPELTAEEVAYLGSGENRLVDAVLGKLVQEKILDLKVSSPNLVVTGRTLPASASDAEKQIYALVAGQKDDYPIQSLRKHFQGMTKAMKARLCELGLLADPTWGVLARCLPTLIMGSVLTIGVIKIYLGVQRHRPVGFLVALVVVTLIIALLFLIPVHRSRLGDRVFSRLKKQNAALVQASRADSFNGSDVMLAVGLMGPAILGNFMLTDLGTRLKRQPSPNVTYGDSGSSCGGGGCGGGGGGCGGCGG